MTPKIMIVSQTPIDWESRYTAADTEKENL